MIRHATPDDLPAMLEMGARFIDKAWSRIGVPYDEPSCTALLTGLMQNGILLFSDEGGMIGIAVHPWHFNQNIMTATELFWWAEPGCRDGAALRKEAERLAKERGARTINMACEHHMRSAALDRLYRMNGYAPSEHVYIKELG